MDNNNENIYKCQSAVDLKFFMEDILAGQYLNKRKEFIENMDVYIRRFADEICKIITKKVRQEILKTYEEKIRMILNNIQEENIINTLSQVMKSDGAEEDEKEEDDIFLLDNKS